MSAENRQDNSVSRNPTYPVISSNPLLEDGEIVEGHVSGNIALPNDQPQFHLSLSNHLSTPTELELVGSLAVTPTLEPMTKEDLDRAKSLVLDLLGWGVSPEYLVECGLSAGAIYKIFTDLRLRLPRNL